MNIAILYRRPDELGKDYPLDSEGRAGFGHVRRIKEALINLGHLPRLVNVDLDTYQHLRTGDFDLAFNLCDDGFRNNSLLEAHLPAMLDILRLPYTGSNFFTLASCLDKGRTKEILTFHNIPTPDFQIFTSAEQILDKDLNFPLIVKPVHEDASIGVREESIVDDLQKLKQRVDFAIRTYNQPALVERFIEGREAYVGILGSNGDLKALPISEVIFGHSAGGRKICTYEAKWRPGSEQYQATPVECPAKLDKGLEHRLIETAKRAYRLLGCQDYGRIDFRIDQNNQPYVLEINPNPDISDDAGLAKMARASGMHYDQLIESVITLALKRSHMAEEIEKVESGADE